MKLSNKGLIFDINQFKPFAKYTHAQSPQLLKVGGVNRVYFSSRPLVKNGEMPTTKVLYVDYDPDLKEIIDYSREPVLGPSIIGAYDEHGIFPFHITKINNRLLGYISGWSRRISVSVETAIGLSESFDNGQTFQRLGDGPIIAASLDEPFLVGDPFIVSNEGKLFMYYIAGADWKETEAESELQRVYKIRMAVSSDGEKWKPEKRNLLNDVLGVDECQALPSVAKFGQISTMAFCYREMSNFRKNGKNAYRIGFAQSSDFLNWSRSDHLFQISDHESGWDEGMRCYPNINILNGRTAILYNGNDFGKHGFGLAIEE